MPVTAIRPGVESPKLAAVETEAALLGALMIDNRQLDRIADLVGPGDFFEALHGRIYALISHEVSRGAIATPITLRPFLEHDPALKELGGPSYLAVLTGSGAALVGVREFAAQIADLAKRRRLHGELMTLADRLTFMDTSGGDAPYQPVEALVADTDAALADALRQAETVKSFTVAQAWDATVAEIEAEAAGDAPPGLAVQGFDDWNELTGNMRRGEVIILAGRPSMGKTAVGLSTALCAARAGWGTLFVSLEMSATELMKRAIADLIFDYGQSASFTAVQRGRFTHFDRERMAATRAQLDAWPLILRQDAGLKVGRLAMMIRRYKRQMAAKGQRLDVVCIDYLGLIRADGSKVKRYEEVSEVSRTVKQIARELDVVIILLAQLNREVERREDKRPMLSDLRDSGEIEQDADVVLFVYREQYYLERAEPEPHDKRRTDWETSMDAARDRVELIAAKVRNGRVGKRNCHFFASHQAVRGSDFFSSGSRR